MKSNVLPMLSALALTLSVLSPVSAHDGEHPEEGKQEGGWPGSAKAQEVARAMLADSQPAADVEAQSSTTCTDGFAGEYPCNNVDLMAFVPLADMGGGKANDIWGWTDPETKREYALQGRTSGTSFVDITDSTNPIYLGNLPTTRFSSTWRDIKVYADHAFIVSEARGHGMQVFDLTRLRSVTSPPVTFSADARYTGFNTAHNIAINEESGFAYAIGTDTCSGGLHIVDIRDPLTPVQAACYSGDGYTHDTQCVNYAGPDDDHNGTLGAAKEICFASNEDTVTIVDVTDKSAPRMLARVSYPGVQYTHQGWLTDDQRYFLVDDELDESRNGHRTHTYVFDMADLDAPTLLHTLTGTTGAIDHNQYVVGNHSFQSNYRGGLRIIDISDKQALREVAYFDTYPADDNTDFNGSWSNYPFFSSGVVVVSDIERGLFVVKPNLGPRDDPPSVTITEPDGTTDVAGTVTVVATATDDSGVTQVEFFVDGTSIGSGTNDGGTWSLSWNSTTVDNGDRTLTAVATDTGGQPASDSVQITVANPNDQPVASFRYSCDNLACAFDGSESTDDDGTIVDYAWDFGDGSTGSGVTVEHSYSVGGTYDVVLTVTDNDGATTQETQTLKVDGPTATMHVGDLDGRATLKGKSGRWEVFVTVTVHDGFENPVDGATVSADWSGAFSGSAIGTTGSDGTVVFSTGTLPGGDSVTLTVNGITHTTLTYAGDDNHDPDGDDSNGTTITVTKN